MYWRETLSYLDNLHLREDAILPLISRLRRRFVDVGEPMDQVLLISMIVLYGPGDDVEEPIVHADLERFPLLPLTFFSRRAFLDRCRIFDNYIFDNYDQWNMIKLSSMEQCRYRR